MPWALQRSRIQRPEIVVADQAGGAQGKLCAQEREIDEDVERGAAGATAYRDDVRKGILLREDVNELDGINDPVAGGENSDTIFHDLGSGVGQSAGGLRMDRRLGGKCAEKTGGRGSMGRV